MSRYAQRFQALHQQHQKGFIPFTLLGWPDEETCQRILKTMIESKPACLELGLPFSDPVADGPVIQEAVSDTLARGFKMKEGFELIRYARSLDSEIPIGLLIYYNTLLAQGTETFFSTLKDLKVDGVLIADLPPEMAHEVSEQAKRYEIDLIFIVSPLTSSERLARFTEMAGGFFYVVSRLGITGTEERYDHELSHLLTRLKQDSSLPAYVGFGISKPEQVKAMLEQGADGTITGSRILQLVKETPPERLEPMLKAYLESMIQVGAPSQVPG